MEKTLRSYLLTAPKRPDLHYPRTKNPFKSATIVPFLILQALWGPSLLFPAQRAALLGNSLIWLEGDSTLHRFSSTSTAMTAEMEGSSLREVKKFTVRIPVASLKSGEGKLDKNLYEALGAKENPEIVFQMKTYEMKLSTEVPGGSAISARGDLIIAGKSRVVTLQGLAKSDPAGTRVDGSFNLLMTDFGVQPPALMLGALKTKNQITVRYVLYFDFQYTK